MTLKILLLISLTFLANTVFAAADTDTILHHDASSIADKVKELTQDKKELEEKYQNLDIRVEEPDDPETSREEFQQLLDSIEENSRAIAALLNFDCLLIQHVDSEEYFLDLSTGSIKSFPRFDDNPFGDPSIDNRNDQNMKLHHSISNGEYGEGLKTLFKSISDGMNVKLAIQNFSVPKIETEEGLILKIFHQEGGRYLLKDIIQVKKNLLLEEMSKSCKEKRRETLFKAAEQYSNLNELENLIQ